MSWIPIAARSSGLRDKSLAFMQGIVPILPARKGAAYDPDLHDRDATLWEIPETRLFLSKEGAEARAAALNPPNKRGKRCQSSSQESTSVTDSVEDYSTDDSSDIGP